MDVAPDGSPVAFYRRLPATGEPDLVASLVTPGASFARTAAAHVTDTGVVIGETYPPGWDPAESVGQERRLGDATVRLERAQLDGDLLDAEVRYGVDGMEWSQPFTARVLDEAAVRALLAEAGLRFDGWQDRPGWFIARPSPEAPPPAPGAVTAS